MKVTLLTLHDDTRLFPRGCFSLCRKRLYFHGVIPFRKLIFGLSVPQQFVCTTFEGLTDPLRVTATAPGVTDGIDVSASHIFLGYRPLIISIVSSSSFLSDIGSHGRICLNFTPGAFQYNTHWRGMPSDRDCIARLLLKRIAVKQLGRYQVSFFEGADGTHHFLKPVHQLMNGLRERVRKQRQGNVDLPGKLYDMVRIAYAVPRSISMLTLCDGDMMNMFPTDLHGSVGDQYYISSLRRGGLATRQVERIRKVTLSSIGANAYSFAYSMGKNHMQNLKPIGKFGDDLLQSHRSDTPLPKHVTSYRELRLRESFDLGIHRIHTYDASPACVVHASESLAHVHQYYVQWRLDRQMPIRIFLRK